MVWVPQLCAYLSSVQLSCMSDLNQALQLQLMLKWLLVTVLSLHPSHQMVLES